MKKAIHPQWFENAVVTCTCGNTFSVGAAKESIHIDICNKCHPFFTGEMRFVDSMGRVEKFKEKQKSAVEMAEKLKEKKLKKKEREAQLRNPKSLKEMLMGIK